VLFQFIGDYRPQTLFWGFPPDPFRSWTALGDRSRQTDPRFLL